jgi:hypothetical protein
MREYNKGMGFTEDAVVHHTLFNYRGDFRWLVARSFWQGYSKRMFDLLYPDSPDDKNDYLRWLLGERVPGRIQGLVASPSIPALTQLVAALVFTAVVGLGYMYAALSLKPVEGVNK